MKTREPTEVKSSMMHLFKKDYYQEVSLKGVLGYLVSVVLCKHMWKDTLITNSMCGLFALPLVCWLCLSSCAALSSHSHPGRTHPVLLRDWAKESCPVPLFHSSLNIYWSLCRREGSQAEKFMHHTCCKGMFQSGGDWRLPVARESALHSIWKDEAELSKRR